MKQKTNKGSALLLTTILLFVILSMVVSLTYVTVMEQKMSQKTKSSVGAFYGAESGVEWALNKLATTTGTNPTVLDAFSNFASSKTACPFGGCDVYLLDKDGKVIISSGELLSNVKAVRSVGSQGGETQRAIEAAVATGGGGCYVDYSLGTGLLVGADCGSGFTVKKSAGKWGSCTKVYADLTGPYHTFFRPPGGNCTGPPALTSTDYGEAYVCCI